MLADAAQRRVTDRVEAVCRSIQDVYALRVTVLDIIREACPFEAYTWLLTDPETSVGAAPYAEVPCFSELPTLIRLRYASRFHRWTSLRGATSVHLPDHLPPQTAQPVLDWCGFVRGYGISDIATVVFRDRFGCWGWLDLWRTANTGRFHEGEVSLLSAVCGVVTSALRRCQARTFVRCTEPRGLPGPAVLRLSPALHVLEMTPQTREYLNALVPPSPGQSPVPASAYNVSAQLLAVEAGVDVHSPLARVHVRAGRWVTVKAARFGEPGAPDSDIAVTLEEISPSDRIDVFARCHGFTAREREVLSLLVTGADTREIGARMFVSEHTVQDHLKSIFAKTACHSRPAVVSRALGS
jgi:DNA-binding CsgD family transcriptional regulator